MARNQRRTRKPALRGQTGSVETWALRRHSPLRGDANDRQVPTLVERLDDNRPRRSALRRAPVEVDVVRRLAIEPRVRAVLVVPRDIRHEFTSKRQLSQRDVKTSSALVLECQKESLDDGDTPLLSDRTESMVNIVVGRPLGDGVARELPFPIRDQDAGRSPRLLHGSIEEISQLHRSRPLLENTCPVAATWPTIDHGSNPPAVRPLQLDSSRTPRHPQSTSERGNDRRVDVPDLIIVSTRGLCPWRCLGFRRRLRKGRLAENPLHRGRADLDTGAAQDLGDLHFSQPRAEHL